MRNQEKNRRVLENVTYFAGIFGSAVGLGAPRSRNHFSLGHCPRVGCSLFVAIIPVYLHCVEYVQGKFWAQAAKRTSALRDLHTTICMEMTSPRSPLSEEGDNTDFFREIRARKKNTNITEKKTKIT